MAFYGLLASQAIGRRMIRVFGQLSLLFTVVFCNLGFSAETTANEEVAFDRVILPLLADKCFRCHGPDEASREADLRLDVREEAVSEDPDSAATIIAFDADASELIRRIESDDADEQMPPPDSNLSLSDHERGLLRQWVNEGAPYAQLWSFRAIERPEVPKTSRRSWPRNPIDSFILSELEQRQWQPAAPADSYRLVRRLYLDLTGLPPRPAEADAFIQDSSPQAYEQLVDRLLSSPAFGERMAWNWLDAARYADSNGYQGDQDRTMWPWRDWVVQSFNNNLPFNQFTIQQLAGDLLPQATDDHRLATGFSRNHMINGEGGRIAEENRVDYVMDMTETMGTVWLGLTLNCCRCHDHKFDPLSRKDYYSLFAFFNQTPVDGNGRSGQAEPTLRVPTRAQNRILSGFEEQIFELQSKVEEIEPVSLSANALNEEQQKILEKPIRERSQDDLSKLRDASPEDSDYKNQIEKLRENLANRDRVRSSIPKVMVMRDRGETRTTFILNKGLYNDRQDEVLASIPEQLPALSEADGKNRLGLAKWIVNRSNPLTARVISNRIWADVFTTGIVKTAEDFGTQGERPTHPELLDWLASELHSSNWDIKHLYRLILTSETYRQSSKSTLEQRELDPENRYLSRGVRRRLPSWMIRDQALFVSGLLVPNLGGPPINTYQPSGVWEDATFGRKSYQRDAGEKLYRRSLYTFWRRIIAPTMFFDTASRQVCTVTNSITNTPLHALTTLNDITYIEAARALATRILRDQPEATSQQNIEAAFRRILIRHPNPTETEVLTNSFDRLLERYRMDQELASKLIQVGELPTDSTVDPQKLAALTSVCNTIMNLDEALCKE